jgi:hypothetical protein
MSSDVDGELVFAGFLFCIPLFVLFVSSLGLIGLKRISRLPHWAARLAAPPVYLVALPIATVITGLLIFTSTFWGWYLVFGPDLWELALKAISLTGLRILLQALPGLLLLLVFSFAGMFVSAYLLWRTLRQKDEQGSRSKHAPRLRALVLLLAFLWTWGTIGWFVYVGFAIEFQAFANDLMPSGADCEIEQRWVDLQRHIHRLFCSIVRA